MTNALAPHINLWVAHENEVVLSGWRIDLLEAIASTGSISAAADQLQVNYRVAWNKIKEMEHGLGVAICDIDHSQGEAL
jgi:molybdate transport system regulatory protein